MKIEVKDCNDSYVCTNYHTICRSVCCDAKVAGRMLFEMNNKLRELSTDEFKKRLASENKKGNWCNVPGVIFRDFCSACGSECNYESRHR